MSHGHMSLNESWVHTGAVMKGNRVLRKINLAWNNIGNEGLRSIMGGLGSQVWCIVLQHGAVCGRVWQCAVVCCSVLQCAEVC